MKVKIAKYKDNKRKVRVEFISDDFHSLYHTLALITLPALQKFRASTPGYPRSLSSEKDWHAILDKMIFAFDHIVNDPISCTKATDRKVQQGLNLFGKWYQALWF